MTCSMNSYQLEFPNYR
uniref:Uncharacterized protein n=1 Tax=Arundo donax TaxID=35708 RepID=A0A0A8YZ81_ARUDO